MSIAHRALSDIALAWMKFVTTGNSNLRRCGPKLRNHGRGVIRRELIRTTAPVMTFWIPPNWNSCVRSTGI